MCEIVRMRGADNIKQLALTLSTCVQPQDKRTSKCLSTATTRSIKQVATV